MKNLSLLFPILCLCFLSCSKQNNIETDYKVYEVHGKVRQIIYTNKETHRNDIVATFNKDGMLLSEKVYERLFEYAYDGLFVKSLKVYNYDSLEMKRAYFYTKKMPTEIHEYDKFGTIRKKVLYEYDENSNRIQGLILSPYNDSLFLWKYNYEQGLIREEKRVSFKEKQIQIDTVSASTQNVYVRSLESFFEYEYNENDELSSITEYIGEEAISKTLYKQFHGIPLQTTIISYWDNAVSDSTFVTYGFDEKGNWIFKRTYSSQGREQRQERTILYYR